MKLTDLCQPLFQYACLLNRSARQGGNNDLHQVRSDIDALFSEMATEVRSEPALRPRFARIQLVLMIFMDEFIRKSQLGFGAKWRSLAESRKITDGDERFFDMLDVALKDPSDGALDELQIYYTCMGLGFTGWYEGQTDHLRKRMLELSARLRGVSENDQDSRIVPEAYEHVDTSDLMVSSGTSIAGILIGLVGVGLVLLVANFYLYQSSFRKLDRTLDHISQAASTQPVQHSTEASERASER